MYAICFSLLLYRIIFFELEKSFGRALRALFSGKLYCIIIRKLLSEQHTRLYCEQDSSRINVMLLFLLEYFTVIKVTFLRKLNF